MENEDLAVRELTEAEIMDIDPEKLTLPLATSTEFNKGYILLNKLIKEVLKDKHIERYTDEHGETRRRTHYHPWTLELMKERRRVLDQIWKMQGGEALNEARKANAKKIAESLWDMQDPDIKNEHKDKFIEVMEAEVEKKRNDE